MYMARIEAQQRHFTRVGVGIVVSFGLVFVYLLFVAGQTAGLQDVNAIECACIARNLARTGHYTTSILKPLSLAKVPRPNDHPDLIYAPLHPLYESIWLRAMNLSPRAIPLAGGTWLFLGALLILFLGSKWFDARVGCLAAVLYVLNLTMLTDAAGGTEGPMLAFLLLVLLAVSVGFAEAQVKTPWRAAAVGAVTGALYLTKEVWGLSVIPAALAVMAASPRSQRGRLVGACLGAFLVVLMPWLVRTAIVTGDPLFSFRWLESVMHTRSYPGNTLYRTFTAQYPSWLLFAVTSPREVIEKAVRGIQIVYAEPVMAPGIFVGALFVSAIMVTLGSPHFEIARYVIYGSYLLAVGAMLILFPDHRLTAPIAGPATLIGVAFFVQMLDRATANLKAAKRRRYSAVAFVLLGLVHSFPTLARMGSGRPVEAIRTEAIRVQVQQVAALTDGLIVTDVPWPLAWFGDRTTIWLPKSPEELGKIESQIGPVQWLLLTPFSQASRETERTDAWIGMWQRGIGSDNSERGYRVYKRLLGDWVLFRRTTAP
jgi:hypothetical protein